jgi:hypothetical protein
MELKEYYQQVLDDLESNCLYVELFPSRIKEQAIRGAKIRVVTSMNTEWYRKLCKKYLSNRKKQRNKIDTRIKRANIISTLKTLIKGGRTNSYLINDLTNIAKEFQKNDEIIPF